MLSYSRIFSFYFSAEETGTIDMANLVILVLFATPLFDHGP